VSIEVEGISRFALGEGAEMPCTSVAPTRIFDLSAWTAKNRCADAAVFEQARKVQTDSTRALP
jgi:hypothetical protein